KQVGHLLQQAETLGIRSRKFAGDKAYDTQPVRHLLKERGINAFIGRRNPPRIPEGFRLKTPQQLQCPQGHVARATRHTQSAGVHFTFSQKLCQRCPLRDGCLPANETRKRLYYNHGGGPHCQDTESTLSKLQSLLSDRDMRLWWIDMLRAPCPV